MDRRTFLTSTTLAATGVAVSQLAKPALATGKKELRMVTSWPKNFPGLGTAARRCGERIEAITEGKFKVKLYGGGELVSPLKCLDAVQQGTADLYHSTDYYYRGKNEGFGFFSSVPFGFTTTEMEGWLHHGGGQQLWDKLSAEFNVKPFPCSNTGMQMGGWFRNPIRSIDDIKGLKMRIPGLGGKVFEALGGSAQLLSGKDIMPALTAGTIDATEWVGPWNDLAFGFYKVLKHYHYPGFHEPGTTLSIGMSKPLWDGLNKTEQAMFSSAILAENNYGHAEFTANNTVALNTMMNKKDVQLHELPDDVFKLLGEATKDVLADAGNSSPIAKEIYESYMNFRGKVIQWSSLSDQAYMNKRSLTEM